MKKSALLLACLLVGAPALADAPQKKSASATRTARRAPPCQEQAPQRTVWPQGTLLWGTGRKVVADEKSSVLTSVDLGRVQLAGTALKGLRLEDGKLVAPSLASEELRGAVLQGAASDGQSVEVAICSAEPSRHDPNMVWYRIEVWNTVSESWENPCIANGRVPSPRALAVRGVWDERGARHEVPGKFTFACENGAIAKCIDWGYKPWAKKDGRSLGELHQACTRMARADYCGDGRSHTHDDNPIDMYDGLAVLTRTKEASAIWEPTRASFEAAWTPEGAWCMARTRDGRGVEAVLAGCPERFEAKAKDLGEGDRCTLLRKDGRTEPTLLRNHSYGKSDQMPSKGAPR
jgi:hypothetical protein